MTREAGSETGPLTQSLPDDQFDVRVSDAENAFDDEYVDVTWDQLRGTRKRRVACLVFLVFVIIGVSVGTGIGVSNNNNSSSDDTLAPPANLDVMCAPTNLQTEEGYSACLNACQPSQCCELVDTNPFSCVDEHRKACATFHASCQHLSRKKTQDAASGQVVVDKACSTTALSTEDGVNNCKSVCKDFMCCFPGPEDYPPCNVSQAWCSEYSACSALSYVDQDGFDSHQEAKDTVEQACSNVSSMEGHTKCTNMCRTSQCCFARIEFPASDDCSHVNCTHYEACNVLYGPQEEPPSGSEDSSGDQGDDDDDDDIDIDEIDDDMVDDTTQGLLVDMRQQVAATCMRENFSSLDGIRKCLGLCQHHFCCFDSDPDKNCSDRLGEECEVYHECRHLSEDEAPVQNDNDLALLCAPPVFDEQGPRPCLHACASHLCCSIDSRLTSSCATDQECGVPYEACAILAPDVVVEDPNLVANVNTYCTDDHLDTAAGVEMCGSFCRQRECCMKTGVGSCQNTDPGFCKEIESCQKMENVVDSNAGASNPGASNPVDSTNGSLEESCGADTTSDDVSFQRCYEKCHEDLCCFAPSESNLNCRYERPTECQNHEPCSILVESDIIDVSEQAVDVACASNPLDSATDYKECHRMCAKHLCCLEEPGSPSYCEDLVEPGTCDKYNNCQKLLTSDPVESSPIDSNPVNPNEPTSDSIEHLCDVDLISNPKSFRKCYEKCHDDLCCFAESSDCRDERRTQCDAHNACSVLVESDVSDVSMQAVDAACDSHPLESAGDFKECHRLCAKHLCCLEEPGSPSYCEDLLDSGTCDIYSGCHALLEDVSEEPPNVEEPSGGGVDSVSEELQQVCNSENLSTLAGFHECYDECYYHMCCFINEESPQGALNCAADRPGECSEYSICAALLEVDVLAATEEAVDDACLSPDVGTTAGFRSCHRLCAAHLCCFQDPEEPSSCHNLLGQAECDIYSSCSFLVTTDNHPNPFTTDDPYLVALVEAYCTEERLLTDLGRETCKRHCHDRSCCFVDGPGGCAETSPNWCNEVQACERLYDGED